MFNLDKSIVLWKNEFYKNDSFTNDDIEELEGHLLDKIYALIKSGLSEEEAFIKAKDSIGTAEVLYDDFSIVNKMAIVSKRIILGLFGYVFIVFLNNIIRSITISISSPFATTLDNRQLGEYNIVGMIIHLMSGNRANALNGLSFVISSIFYIILIHFLVSNKFNIINTISNKVNSIIQSKPYLAIPKIISVMILLTLLIIGTPMAYTMVLNNINPNEISSVYIGTNISRYMFDFILVVIFIYTLYSKVRSNKNLYFTLCGYLTGNILIITIPIIVFNIISRLNTSRIGFKLTYFVLYVAIAGLIILMSILIKSKLVIKSNNKVKLLIDRSMKMKVLLGIFMLIVYGGIILYVPHININLIFSKGIDIDKYLVMGNVMELFIIMLAQAIISIVLIKKTKLKRKIA